MSSQGVLLGRGLSQQFRQGADRQPHPQLLRRRRSPIAYWLQEADLSRFQGRAGVLDMATQSGANLLGYPRAFPGCEAYGIDVAAPGLRYGHAGRPEFEGLPVHFSQQNARKGCFSFRGQLIHLRPGHPSSSC